jgi:pimeloyl-ACP methyl ester carboxylesterase
LNWYRANITAESFGQPVPMPLAPVSCPVLGVWSAEDCACGEAQMLASQRLVSGPWRYHRVDGVGHWIPLAAPRELITLLLGYLDEELPCRVSASSPTST